MTEDGYFVSVEDSELRETYMTMADLKQDQALNMFTF